MREVMSDRLSVVVPTRNRPDHAAECAKAILAGGGFDELILVDQSDGDETEKALKAPGVRCLRSNLRGATLRGRSPEHAAPDFARLRSMYQVDRTALIRPLLVAPK